MDTKIIIVGCLLTFSAVSCKKATQDQIPQKSPSLESLMGPGGGGGNFNKLFEWVEGGKKWGSCPVDGDNCKVKPTTTDTLIDSAKVVLQTYLDANDVIGYFQNEDWSILFPELTPAIVTQLVTGTANLYKIETLDPLTYIYAVSTALNVEDVNAENLLIGVWQY